MCCPISPPPNNVYKVRTTSLVCVRVMSDILEAAHGEACKTQMFLTSWKRRLVVLIMSTAPSSTESTKNTVHYWRDARVFDTPSFPRASHVLQAFCHTCHEYAYTHCGFLSLTFIFLNFCVTMHYLWQEVSWVHFSMDEYSCICFLLVSEGFLSRKIDHDIQCTTLRPLPSIY